MSKRLHTIEIQRRQVFHAWIKWAPMLAVAFGALFFDTWLSIESRNNDYELSDLKRQQRELTATLEQLRMERAQLENLDILATRAPDLGLVAPTPNQIVAVLVEGESTTPSSITPPIMTARLEWETMATDVGVLLTSKVPKAVESNRVLGEGGVYLEESMDDLLVSF